ncbi:MAG: hypothetical protein FJ154_06845 [Gammaproteobacteria bacterium]|nr:hypothetical protein [Gammaproteobacteria bacterium]
MLFLIYGAVGALLAGVCCFASSRSFARSLKLALLAFVIVGWTGWFFLPVLGWNFVGAWVLAIASTALGTSWGSLSPRKTYSGAVVIPIVIPIIGVALAFVTTSAIFHADDYRKLLGPVTESRFTEDVSPIDIRQVRIVDGELARNIGQKRLGEIPGLGSRVELGDMNIQLLDGCFSIREYDGTAKELCFDKEFIWAGPLNHDSLFRWFSHEVTPGYVLVSATDASKVYMVTSITPKETDGGLRLRYLRAGAYFGDHLERHLRANGFVTAGLTSGVFEIRDDGRPFWVVTRYVKRIGFSGEDPIGVVIVDAQTGAIEEFDIASAPSWVDRIQPQDFVVEQLDNWGQYVRGWWNSLFARLDVIQSTPGMSLVYGTDGRTNWYTGMQSAGADDATVGFVLVDTRTRQVRWYRMPGAKETSAQLAAENARGVREAGFDATFPVLYNIGGIPTYLMTLKGGDGLVKMFAFVSAQNLMVVGVDSTIQNALRNYQNSLQQQGRTLVTDDLVKQQQLEALVLAIARERRGDVEYYYLILSGREDTEFYAAPELSPELKWTRVGDRVVIDFDEGKARSVLINGFDNPRLALVNGP